MKKEIGLKLNPQKNKIMQEKENIPQDIQPIQVSTLIHAPIERIWKAITEPEQLRQWFVGVDTDKIEDGTSFQFIELFGEEQVVHEALVLEFEENSLLRHTWTYPELSQWSSTVNWDLETEGNHVKVIVTHEGIHHIAQDIPDLSPIRIYKFWDKALNKHLKIFVERNIQAKEIPPNF